MSIQKSKLYRLLNALSGEEVDQFEQYLASPLLNRSQMAIRLYELLQPWFPVLDEEAADWIEGRAESLEKTRLFAQLFPDHAYQDSKLSNLMTTLGQLVEQFLVWRHLQQDSQLQERALLLELRQRAGLEDDFQRAWQKTMQAWEKNPSDDPGQWFLTLELYEQMLSFQNTHLARSKENLLATTLDHLRGFVLLLNLKYYLAAFNRQRLVSEELDSSLQHQLIAYLEERPDLAEKPPLRIYLRLIHCLHEPENPAHFTQLKAILEPDIDLLSSTEARQLYYLTLNYLNGRLKSGQAHILPELLALYRAAFDRGLFFSDGFLDGNIYLNILNVVSGVIRELKEEAERKELIDWREDFLHEQSDRLHPGHRAAIYQYAQAYMHYQLGEYSEAYRILTHYRDDDVISDISRRLLLIRVYYDARDPDLFDAQVKSALMYISRAEAVSEPKRLAYNRFVRLTRRLFALEGKGGSSAKVNAIQTEILAPHPLECRQWLQEKCEEMLILS